MRWQTEATTRRSAGKPLEIPDLPLSSTSKDLVVVDVDGGGVAGGAAGEVGGG